MVFGVFDGLHPGHRSFLKQAAAKGDYLIAVAARDKIVQLLKKHPPKFKLTKRLACLRKISAVKLAVPGDRKIGTYGVVLKHKPDIIAFGYDQKLFAKDLRAKSNIFKRKPKFIFLSAHKPHKYKSSLLRLRKN